MQKFLFVLIIVLGIVTAKVFGTSPPGVGPTGTITGYVVALAYPTPDAPEQPVPKAGVKVHIAGTSLFAFTDTNGNYTIENVPVGPLYAVIAYDVDQNLPAGTGTVWTNLEGDDAVRFGVYLTSLNQILTIPTLTVNHSYLGAP